MKWLLVVLWPLALAVFSLVAADDDSSWPAFAQVPKELDKHGLERYGRKVEYLSETQRQALWNARVRRDHPRIYFNAETLPVLRERLKSHPAWPELQNRADAGDLLATAFAFQVTGNKKYAQAPLAVLMGDEWLKKGAKLDAYTLALLFDWCFNAIPAENFEEIVKKVADAALPDEKTDAGFNAPKRFQPWRWGMAPTRGTDMPDMGVVHIHLALAHHWPGAHVDGMNFWHPDGSGMGDELARDGYSVDGSLSLFEGRVRLVDGAGPKNRYAFISATGVDVLDEKAWGSNAHNMLYWFLYNTELSGGHELDYYYCPLGKGPQALRNDGRLCLHGMNYVPRNPHYQWFLNHVLYPGGPVEAFHKAKAETIRWIELALWYDPNLAEKSPDDLPKGRFLAPGVMQNAVFRSGFAGKGDAIALFLFSDSWDGDSIGGAHFGSFKLFRDEYISAPTFGGPFWRTTYGHNNIAFFDTATRAKEGFDKPIHPEGFECNFRQIEFIQRAPKRIEGTVTGFETHAAYDYLAFKSEPTFYLPETVKEWTGQVVFLRPGVLVRFDRTEAGRPGLQPRFFLWATGEQMKVSGNMIASTIYDHVEDYDGDEASWLGHLQQSRFHLKALLPKQKHIRMARGQLGNTDSAALAPGTFRATYDPKANKGPGKEPGKGLVLSMNLKTKTGTQKLPALVVGPAPQRRAGALVLKVGKDSLRATQTSAEKDEDLPFERCPALCDLSDTLNGLDFWSFILANYEHWVEGNIFKRALLEDGEQPPVFDEIGALSEKRRKAILGGDPGRRDDILNPRAAGHIEIRLPDIKAEPRQYFLNVMTLSDAEGKNPTAPESTLVEDDQTATAVLKWPEREARIVFRKSGEAGGHITISEAGKTVVDRDFTRQLETTGQAFGTDFLTGKRK